MGKRNVLVVGHRGFIGRHLFQALKGRDDIELLGFDLTDEDLRGGTYLDFANPRQVVGVLERFDVIFNCAGVSSVDVSRVNPEHAFGNSLAIIDNLLRFKRPDATLVLLGSLPTVGVSPLSVVSDILPCMVDSYASLGNQNTFILGLGEVYGAGGHGLLDGLRAGRVSEVATTDVAGDYIYRRFIPVGEVVHYLVGYVGGRLERDVNLGYPCALKDIVVNVSGVTAVSESGRRCIDGKFTPVSLGVHLSDLLSYVESGR